MGREAQAQEGYQYNNYCDIEEHRKAMDNTQVTYI